jgi:hypothetical protein
MSKKLFSFPKIIYLMKQYTIVKESSMWSTKQLIARVEKILNEKNQEGYQIVSVSFGLNIWWIPTAFITICK